MVSCYINKFYGVVKSYDSEHKKYVVLYDDGDVEVLRLDKEHWELVDNGHKPTKPMEIYVDDEAKLILHGLVQIRTLGMLRSKFQSLPAAFNACLILEEKSEPTKKKGLLKSIFSRNFAQIPSSNEKATVRFAQLWNTIISSFREEDLISDWKWTCCLFHIDRELDLIQWPPFLLASKIPIALDTAKDSNGKDRELKKRIEADDYMSCAVRECYASFQNIIKNLVQGGREKEVIEYILTKVDKHIEEGKLLTEYNMGGLPSLYDPFVKLIKYLGLGCVILFQDMLEVVTRDIMMEDHINSLVDSIHGGSGHEGMVLLEYQLFASAGAINFSIKRLDLLLTVKESAMDVLFSLRELEVQNEDGVSILFYVQKIFLEEFKGLDKLEEDKVEKLRLWASYRGQTLTRTDLMEGYKAVELNMEDQIKGERSLWAQCQAVADMKYPSLRVAYIDEVEEPSKDASKKINQKVYYSKLVKAALPKSANSSKAVQNLDQVKTKALF
ncbi:Callose synthase 3 [Camellia lanceoleosa]|uniref:Callose synthase 3 n=1 Tax=Camellia lanceoleosa TaxID=1840588 RepID=A0ACC0GSW1_9ERIC|nr:Callose synthase 3 [Camellia lanceoleosa]